MVSEPFVERKRNKRRTNTYHKRIPKEDTPLVGGQGLKPRPPKHYLLVKGNNAMMRARLMALASLRWCLEQTPLRLRGTILA